jgi:hypothetical protein
MKGMNTQCSRGETCRASGQMIGIRDTAALVVPATLVKVGVAGNVEASTRDTGAQRWVAAGKAKTGSGKVTLATTVVAIGLVVIILVAVVVVVVFVAAKNETPQFQQDGPQLSSA